MQDPTTVLTLNIEPTEGMTSDELDALTIDLLEGIERTPVELVERGSVGKAPSGTKATDAATLNTILVALTAAGGVLPSLVLVLKDFVNRNANNSIVVKGKNGIEVTIKGNYSEEQVQNAIHQVLQDE